MREEATDEVGDVDEEEDFLEALAAGFLTPVTDFTSVSCKLVDVVVGECFRGNAIGCSSVDGGEECSCLLLTPAADELVVHTEASPLSMAERLSNIDL